MGTKSLMMIVLLTIILYAECQTATNSKPLCFPAVFYFGDSTVDTGNNNYIFSLLQANHHPYGVEFPGQVPSGRFSSGKLVPDFISSYLGIKDTVPPYLDPNLSDKDLLTGLSFASGGSGYDDLTSLGQVITMQSQVRYFQIYKGRVGQIVGRNEAEKLVNSSLVVISAGTNDFGMNYYDIPTRRFQYDINGYQNYLLNRLTNRLQELYNLGLRTFVVAGLPPLGCIPIQMTVKFRSPFLFNNRDCLVEENNDARVYNQKLVNLLTRLKKSVPGAKFEYADIYNPILDMVRHPKKYGFEVVDRGCCGTGLLEAGSLCTAFSPICANPKKNLFWDSIHPGQTAYSFLSKALQKDLFPKLLQQNTTDSS